MGISVSYPLLRQKKEGNLRTMARQDSSDMVPKFEKIYVLKDGI